MLLIVALGFGSLVLAVPLAFDADGSFSSRFASSSEGPVAIAGSLVGAVLDGLEGQDDERVHLTVPDRDALLVPPWPHAPAPVPAGELRAHAYQYVSRVFSRPAERPRAMGFVRRGIVLHARERTPGPGCRGAWYALRGGGFVCSTDGFAIARTPREPIEQPMPAVARALPYRYAKVKSDDALRFHRVPTASEEREIERAFEQGQRLPDVVDRRLDGVYLLALDRAERAGERLFQRTVRGRYVRADDLEPKAEPAMRGELLGEDNALPYAFVYGQGEAKVPVYRIAEEGDALQPVGVADNHARLPAVRDAIIGDRAFVVGSHGLVLERAVVRVANKIERPTQVPAGAKWIHVDLSEQVLVAYEGARPVFATLVSSGKGEGFATPTGLYQIDEKHITTTMRGPDPDEGVYEVGEVPWTMFYDEGYALHGAYWHDSFGKPRSHGCTNIAPIDARWLFYWTEGKLPRGFHALRKLKSTYVYLTGEAHVSEPASG